MRALKVSYSDLGEGGVAANCEKPQFFLYVLDEDKWADIYPSCGGAQQSPVDIKSSDVMNRRRTVV